MKTFPINFHINSAVASTMNASLPSEIIELVLKSQFSTEVSGELEVFVVIESREHKNISICERRASGFASTKTTPEIAKAMIESAEAKGFKVSGQYCNSKLYTVYQK